MSSNDLDPAIDTDRLTKRYGSKAAIEDLSLTVESGEIYGFLGPNGAGKSTTINLLMDYARPTEGSCRVLGMNPRDDVVSVHQQVGILPDGFSVYENRTGHDHLRLVIDTKRADDDPERLLERVGLADAIDDKAGSYSRGMRQRLALAMALVGEPDLLILDEPFSGLDPHGVRTVREIAHAENDRGATVFFSSHVLGQVELVCDRIGILHEGRLVAEGTVEELRANAPVATELELTIDGDSDRARRTAAAVDGVTDAFLDSPTDASSDADTAGGRLTETAAESMTVHLESPERREAVVAAIEDAGIRVERTSVDEPSVESLFVAYTDDGSNGGDRE
ncbi:ABC transporter ATP-binding protein [Natronobacterium texcoconense]|uniref:ABC-2 type transport system ATP-binding protein n=1 Tax=Natronobacterium texcoconense TaxID=1095778 RepID=A0A1H1IDH4_NATTX|nr:ABC transporter ATP-binding protein [Natronobacterium texcoconense]SDR35418.1 ABC-2 type transport system ATP-binding protein [Natronobacterium texcoconense]